MNVEAFVHSLGFAACLSKNFTSEASYLPISSYIFLYLPISSYIFLYLPISSYIFLYLPISSNNFQ